MGVDLIWKIGIAFLILIYAIYKNSFTKRLISIKVIFLIIFLIGGFISYFSLISLDDYIPFNKYEYEFDSHRLNATGDFKIYHDFSKDKGNISFIIREDWYQEEDFDITISLPILIDNSTLKIESWSEEEGYKRINNWNTRETIGFGVLQTRIDINDIPKSNEEEVLYQVSYEMKLLPSGHFMFNHNYGGLWGYASTIALDLGKKYKCMGTCVDIIQFVVPDYPNTDKEIRLEFQDDNKNKNHSFILKGVRDIRVRQGLSLGFLVSFVISFLLVLMNLTEEIKYKKKSKYKIKK